MSTTQAAAAPPAFVDPRAVIATFGALVVATITLLTVFEVVAWSAAQTALVVAEATAVTGLVAAIVAHLTPATKKEPVALAATFTATISATLALGSGFAWWSMSEEETSAVVGVVTAVVAVGGAVLTRRHVHVETSAGRAPAGRI